MRSARIVDGAATWHWLEIHAPSFQELGLMEAHYRRLRGLISGDVPATSASIREAAAQRRLIREMAAGLTMGQRAALLSGYLRGHCMQHLQMKGLVRREAEHPRYELTWLGAAVVARIREDHSHDVAAN